MTVYEFYDLSYKDQFNAVRNLTIKEADGIEEKYSQLKYGFNYNIKGVAI